MNAGLTRGGVPYRVQLKGRSLAAPKLKPNAGGPTPLLFFSDHVTEDLEPGVSVPLRSQSPTTGYVVAAPNAKLKFAPPAFAVLRRLHCFELETYVPIPSHHR
jgi:hypothetical protein